MKTAVIRYRVADFLKRFAPFDALPERELLDLAGSGRVKFHESEEYIFRQGQAKGPFVWIIQQGRLELLHESPEREQLRDVLGEGDMLGLDGFLGDGLYLNSARTASDVILYSIDASLFGDLAVRYAEVKRYCAAHFSVAGTPVAGRTSWLDAPAPPADFLGARLVVVGPDATLAEAASRLKTARNGAVAVVDSAQRPVGLITAGEICAAAAGLSGLLPQPLPPAIAVGTTRDAVREMVRARAEALAITRDGVPDSPLESILTASDLALFCRHNPARLVREILDAVSIEELKPLLRQGARIVLDGLAQAADVDDCALIGSEIVAALAETCIRLARQEAALEGIEPPAVPYCWLTFGRLARGELLRPALPGIGVAYDDSHSACAPEAGSYFARVAGEAAAWLRACGLEGPGMVCPDGAQPCMPLSEWKRFYRETIRDPIGHDLYARREFFDVRPLFGDGSLLEELRNSIASELKDHAILILVLANDTLAHLPPLTFFRGLVLELNGALRSSFDLTESALDPISGAARVFALGKQGVSGANTLERLEAAAIDFPEGASVLREAAEAFRIALYHRTLAGGSLIEPSKLGRYDQRLVITAFSSILRLLELTTSTFVPLHEGPTIPGLF